MRASCFGPRIGLPIVICVVGALGLLATGAARADGTTWVVPSDGSNYVFVDGSDEDDSQDAYLGVRLTEETDYAEGGARITRVIEDSPAHEAGLRRGDIVVEFDGRVVRGPAALTQRLHEKSAGDEVVVVVVRDGLRQSLTVELGERSRRWAYSVGPRYRWGGSPDWEDLDDDTREDIENKLRRVLPMIPERLEGLRGLSCPGGDCSWNWQFGLGRPVLGVELVETTPELRRHLGGDEDAGVLVGKVLAGMPAEASGIRVGDLIVRVAGQKVGDVSDLRRALRDRSGDTVSVEVVRDGSTERLEVVLPDPDRDPPTGPRA